MSNTDTVLVTIHSRQHIPLIRQLGPILQPISIERSVAETLKAMGVDVRFHEKKDVKVDTKTGVRELIKETDFARAPQGSSVTPNTEYPEPAIGKTEVTAPEVTEPTLLASSNEGVTEGNTSQTEVTTEGESDEANSQEETQEEANTQDPKVDLTPDLDDTTTLSPEDEAAIMAASDEETTDEESEDESLPVYTKEVYAEWTKAQLLTYLSGAEEYLPKEVFAGLKSANKTTLLEIVNTHILPLVEEDQED